MLRCALNVAPVSSSHGDFNPRDQPGAGLLTFSRFQTGLQQLRAGIMSVGAP